MNRHLMIIVSLVILTSVLSAACAAPTPQVVEKVIEKPVEKVVVATAPPAAPKSPSPSKASMKDCFVPDQVLLTGHAGDITDSTKSIGGLTLQATFKLDYFTKLLPDLKTGQNPPLLPSFPNDKYDDLVIQLYKVTAGDPAQIVQGINDSRSKGGKNVYADLNYLIGYPLQGLTWITEGSPAGPKPITATQTAYNDQWAFKQIGLSAKVLEPTKKGYGVLVGVFDAFPGKDAPSPYAILDPPQPPIDVSDHGPFVTGLLTSVAPMSKVQEYRVLNEFGQGTLDSLIDKLNIFLNDAANNKNNYKGVVINLSLGAGANCSLTQQDTLTIHSLGNLLVGAYRSNMVIVAAAGNDSNLRAVPAVDLPARLPAKWGNFVIGAGASNQKSQRACFSNKGNVLAPGGEGDKDCKSAVEGVVSYVPRKQNYYSWAGTSFATPLVSGLAALVLGEKGDTFKQVYAATGSYMTPTVNRAIACRDDWGISGNRVIIVPETLSTNCLKLTGITPLSLTANPANNSYTGNVDPLSGAVITGVSAPVGMRLVHTDTSKTVENKPANAGSLLGDFNGMKVAGSWTVSPVGSVPPVIWITWKVP
jgi:hypothetical protein